MTVSPSPPAATAPGPRAPRSLVVFSDGTGNSSAKLFKTNVWRLYQAVDTAEPDAAAQAAGARRQLVAYDDGVGTSGFKPLALLGGVFGLGLMRNVLDLYRFLCRNYEPGDQIYAFGFSRGAFTIRVLIGLVTMIGLVRADDDSKLELLSNDAYRHFRRCFRLGGNRDPARTGQQKRRDLTDILVTPLRDWRDARIKRKRKRLGLPLLDPDDPNQITQIAEIDFVGVWDTVAAYGAPIAEITRGIDRWVWPLSMPDYKLSEKVKVARHALSLDDERDTFHPLLWDEVHEDALIRAGKVLAERLRQVWFAGVHSDVGGGYPDDSLAHVSLVWMADEAVTAGLRLHPFLLADYRRTANPSGPVHDSRAGLASYYRYQPRKISSRLDPPDPTTLSAQDPDFAGRGLLMRARLHESVIDRITRGTDRYAPLVLPSSYLVEGIAAASEQHAGLRGSAQERVWDDVWRRRINFFLTLAMTLLLVAMPVLEALWPASICIGPQCVLAPLIGSIGGVLPDFLDPWLTAFAARPGLTLLLVGALLWLLGRTAKLKAAMQDRMRRLFTMSFNLPTTAGPGGGAAGMKSAQADASAADWVRRLRTGAAYQNGLRWFKWHGAPGLAATAIYASAMALCVLVVLIAVASAHRVHLAYAERSGRYCGAPTQAIHSPRGELLFPTADMCWRVPGSVEAGKSYRLRLDVYETWKDAAIPASPVGFGSERFAWWMRLPAILLRRSINDPWFRPLLHVEGKTLAPGALKSVSMRLVDYQNRIYVGEFVAPADGQLVLSVNDAVFLWGGNDRYFYTGQKGQNRGLASVRVEPCDDDALVEVCARPR
jgi:uncharacterized protein (DUF2235 family)